MFAVQSWLSDLTIMQQSVLLAAIRGPDGLDKNHVAKVLLRWYRRCILVSAFDGRALETPYEPGGGSFTGPCESNIDDAVTEYLRSLDQVPHHFQLHFMHAAEILGYKHPHSFTKAWWHRVYRFLAQDMHLNPETEEQMDYRLGDCKVQWQSKEVVTNG